jgi:hypothetical protein
MAIQTEDENRPEKVRREMASRNRKPLSSHESGQKLKRTPTLFFLTLPKRYINIADGFGVPQSTGAYRRAEDAKAICSQHHRVNGKRTRYARE